MTINTTPNDDVSEAPASAWEAFEAHKNSQRLPYIMKPNTPINMRGRSENNANTPTDTLESAESLSQNTSNTEDASVDAYEEDTLTENGQDPNEADSSDQGDTEGANKETHDWEKRYADLRSHSQKRENELRKELDALKEEVTSKEKLANIDFSKIEKLEKEHPTLYKAMEAMLVKRFEEEKNTKLSDLQEIKKEIQNFQTVRAMEELASIHPDVNEIKESDGFKEWYERQSTTMQALFKGEVTDVARGIDFYKQDAGISKRPKTVAKNDPALAVKPGKNKVPMKAPKTWRASQVRRMTDVEFDRYQEEIELAIAEDRYIDD